MSEHSCEVWISQRISCPSGLIQALGRRGGGGDALAVPDDEIVHERASEPSRVPADGYELERFVLIELNKRLQNERRFKTPRETTVEKLRERGGARVPAELVREAIRQGSRHPELGVWVAAAALLLAAGARANQAPQVVRGLIGAVGRLRGVSRRGIVRTGGPQLFNSRDLLNRLMQVGAKRLFDSERSGAGEFFPGTEG